MLIARGAFGELDRLFFRSFTVSLAVSCIAFGMILQLECLVHRLCAPVGDRILPPLPAALFLLSAVFSSVTVNLGTYLRAHKQEPLAVVYLLSTALAMGLAWCLGTRFGAIGVAGAYCSVV